MSYHIIQPYKKNKVIVHSTDISHIDACVGISLDQIIF